MVDVNEQCERLRWGFYEMPDMVIKRVEREVFEKLFPGVPLFEDEINPDYDYDSPQHKAACAAFYSITDRSAEARALQAAHGDAMQTLDLYYRPAFEAMLKAAMETTYKTEEPSPLSWTGLSGPFCC
jgi:hypothetical protein